jgi:hypothetical protein
MRALLILSERNGNAKIIVNIKEKMVINRVVSLLEDNRGREAFDLLKKRAEVESFLPPGTKLITNAQITLVEDLI